MSASPQKRDESSTPPRQTVILLLSDMGDTTWRMFVPTIGLTIVGLQLDRQFGTSPWLLIAGLVIGVALAAILVRRQLKKVAQKK